MKLFLIAALIAVAAAAPSGYHASGYAQPNIVIVRQSDDRHGVQSANWSYEGSDGTTREESVVQTKNAGYAASNGYGDNYSQGGSANKGSTYWISPEGERVTLSWTADERGVLAAGSHLPVAPAHLYSRGTTW